MMGNEARPYIARGQTHALRVVSMPMPAGAISLPLSDSIEKPFSRIKQIPITKY